jgi:superfamily II DNA or RNA helicase
MSLIPLLQKIKINLPELILDQGKIGGNFYRRYAFRMQKVEVDVYDSEYEGWYVLETGLHTPYDILHLRKSGNFKNIPKEKLCLEFKKQCDIYNLSENTKFKWLQHPAINNSKNPDEIVQSWQGVFQFRQDNPKCNQAGLRTPQIGALHAISAYFSLKRNLEPITVVLPTGTGKTETMLSVLIYKKLQKVLVVVPSSSLRSQITEKFYDLGYLPKLSIVPGDIAYPYVTTITTGIKSVAEAKSLLSHTNVFIATAHVLKSSNQEAIDYLCEGISDLFIDEAHHISAATWTKIRDRFTSKRIVQFTATPFRNDGSSLGGRVIYNYTMGEAQEAEYFQHINLIAVEEYFLGKGDMAIATAAVKVLRSDLDNDYDHLLMARVEKIKRANELLPIYKKIAPDLNPVVIHSRMNKGELGNALYLLLSLKSKIAICVNMLGEGFDLPNLKVAAIHDIHKSLAITLQFIGRFTRQTKDLKIGNASVVVNIAEPKVENGLNNLYSQDADWDNILRRLSEKRIEREVRLQDVVEHLKEKGTLHKQLSLWNLRPSCSAVLFKTNCDDWNPERFEEILPKDSEHWFAISKEEKMLIVLALHQAPVKWGNYKELNDVLYKLLIVQWDDKRSALFVYANDYNWFRVQKLAELISDEQCELFSGPKVFNVFNGLEYPLVKNLGGSQVGAISFTQYFGSNVTQGLSLIESSEMSLSNLAGLGYDNGEKVIWGCSQKKGKIWSVHSGSIPDWSDWVRTAWDKVNTGDIDESNITRDFLRPQKLENYYSLYACSVQWGEHIQADPEDKVTVLFGDVEIPLYLVDLKIVSQENGQPYHISISSTSIESVYSFSIDKKLNGGFAYTLVKGNNVSIKRGNGRVKQLEEYLLEDPWIIQYIDCSYSYNCFLIKLHHTIGEFKADDIECWDWSGVNIKKESMGKYQAKDTVQWKSYEKIKTLYDVIINDDGSGEAADLVGLTIVEDEIHLGLIHCKYSGENTPGARIGDLYEVCGQAQKSIRWKHGGIKRLYEHLKHREGLWQKDNVSRFLKGSISDLANIKCRSRTARLKLDVYIIQPGLRKTRVSAEMLKVLGSTTLYLNKTAQAELIVVGSS